MEKIDIKNFSGISSLSIEIKRFNILIGEQATGKSILAKLCYLFKSFPSSIFEAVENEDDKRSLDKTFLNEFCEYFPEVTWGKGAFSITYSIGDESIQISRKANKKPKLTYTEFYTKHFSKLRSQNSKLQKNNSEEVEDDPRRRRGRERWEILRKLRNIHITACQEALGSFAAGHQLFIPAGRSFFANLENNIFSFLSSNNQLDPFLRNFGSYYESVKDFRERRWSYPEGAREKKLEEAIASHMKNIIRGEYKREKRKDYIFTNDSRKVPLSTSSSGQQETLPLLLILSELTQRGFRGSQSVYIEEPEAHLFPRAQKEITELISLAHMVNKGLQIFITTHSPYILTCLNNVIQRAESSKELIPQISISDVSAYALSQQSAQDLIDKEEGLIDASIIDEVSNELAREFEELI